MSAAKKIHKRPFSLFAYSAAGRFFFAAIIVVLLWLAYGWAVSAIRA